MTPLRNNIPTATRPLISISLILLCTLIYLWQVAQPERLENVVIRSYGLVPAVLFNHLPPTRWPNTPPAMLTLFSAMFLHGSWMHLISNLFFLWLFGKNVEQAMGHARFAIFYLLCGIVGALSFALANAHSAVPMIGASGAISGILGAYLLLYPRIKISVFKWPSIFSQILTLPALLVLVYWIVLQMLNLTLADPTQGGVAWGAHIGGFVAGMTLNPLFTKNQGAVYRRNF